MNDTERALFLVYAVDCEPLAARSPMCGGPASWEVSEKAILRYAEIFRRRGMMRGLSFHTTPEAGKAHRDLLLALNREGCGLGLQLNVPGFRFPKYKQDLGCYDLDEQRQIIRDATADFAETFGFRPQTYTPCCGSKNRHTYPLLVELGYRQTHAAGPGRYLPDRPDRCTVGSFPFPYWASAEHPLLSGNLPLYVIPNAGELTCERGRRPFDLRPESPPTPETHERYRRVIRQSIEMQKLIAQPVKAIAIGAHNTERVNFENVEFAIACVREEAEREGLDLIPASCAMVRESAEQRRAAPSCQAGGRS